eukprot:Pgem_evm1s14125
MTGQRIEISSDWIQSESSSNFHESQVLNRKSLFRMPSTDDHQEQGYISATNNHHALTSSSSLPPLSATIPPITLNTSSASAIG